MRFTRIEDRRFVIERVRLPLVAFIDIILFLLIFFVMAGTLAAEERALAAGLRVDRGRAGPGADLLPQIVQVERGDRGEVRYRVGERIASDRATLTAILARLPRAPGVVVRVRGEASVEMAATAMQACRDAGFLRISYVPAP